MNRCRLVLPSLLLAPGAWAQRPPRAGYVYPAGGQQGTTFEAVVVGQYLINSTNVFVTGAGVRVTVAEQEELLTPLLSPVLPPPQKQSCYQYLVPCCHPAQIHHEADSHTRSIR